MVEFEAVIRKFGDSLGIILPPPVVDQIQGRPGQTVRIVIPTTVDWSELWGGFSANDSTDALIRKARTDRD